MIGLLQVRVGVCVKTLLVLDLVGEFVLADHVDGQEVDYGLLPGYRAQGVD
jgi:hypothetical protein